MIKNIKSIITFSSKNKIFLIYFTENFWRYIINAYNEPKQDNILICYELRNIFKRYYELVMEVYKDKSNKFSIKNDAINYYKRDEFAFLLDKIIRTFINNNKDLNSIEKLAFITQYNPYYQERNINKVNLAIFDFFDADNIDNYFIKDFRNMEFESIFKENIADYINKLFEKIKKISNFEKIIKLINVKNLSDKNILLDSLKK